jgi:LysM repeat protein
VTRTRRIILAATVALALGLPATGTIAHAAPASGSAQAAPTSITVVRGDSLAGIAQRYGVRFSALLKANSMTVTSVIHPGDTLVLPAGATVPTTPAPTATSAAPTPTTLTSAAATMTTYVVKAGDALAGIAARNGVKLGALLKANNLTVASVIHPGRSLSIPPPTMPVPAPRAASAPVSASAAAVAGTAVSTATTTTAGGTIAAMLDYLRAQVGVPYRFFSAGPDAFDCSGLVVAGFRQIGIQLPQQSRALATKGDAVDWTTTSIAPGDLVFTSAVGDPTMITHVGIALDSRTWVQAVGVGRTVTIGSLPASSKIMAVRRISLP